MARAIIRYSINGEASNATGNQVRGRLGEADFEWVGTASFEAEGPDVDELLDALGDVLRTLKSPPGGGTVDHVWIYLDSPTRE